MVRRGFRHRNQGRLLIPPSDRPVAGGFTALDLACIRLGMSTSNQIRRQITHYDNLQKSLLYATDPNTKKPAAGQEQHYAALKQEHDQIDINALHGNLSNVENFITKLYDPNFNFQTGIEDRSMFRALGEKLHLVKPLAGLAPTTGAAAPMTMLAGQKPEGLLVPGNINLNNRPVIQNADGSHSSEFSFSAADDQGREVLVPTIVDGKFLTSDGKKPPEGSPEEAAMKQRAWQHYLQTGQHMGIFDNPEHADTYAQAVHSRPDVQVRQALTPQAQRKTAGVARADLNFVEGDFSDQFGFHVDGVAVAADLQAQQLLGLPGQHFIG